MMLAAISLVLMLVAGACAAEETVSPLIPLNERKPAPELKLEDIDGKLQNLTDLRGKVVLVNFWATSCEPCVRELPGIVQALSRFEAGFPRYYATSSNSTSNINVALGGITPPAPRAP